MDLELTSFLAGKPLATLPVVSGSWKLSDEAAVAVPGAIEFSVPATDEWVPATPTHPLASYGQRVRARIDGTTWAWFRMNRPRRDGEVIQCSGQGLLREADRARLLLSWQTVDGDTRGSVAKALLAGILPVVISPALTDEAMPITLWEEDRLAAFFEVLETWPARVEMRDQAVWVLPAWDDATPGAPVGALVDGEGGTLIDLAPASDDDDPYNGCVASTVPAEDEAAVVAFWGMPDGPMAWGGPYGQNPRFFSSSLNPTDRTALTAIAEKLTRRDVGAGLTLTFTAVPDPTMRPGDVVTVRSSRRGVDGFVRKTAVEITRDALTGSVAMLP